MLPPMAKGLPKPEDDLTARVDTFIARWQATATSSGPPLGLRLVHQNLLRARGCVHIAQR
jgi:hypothetical protein